MGLPSQMPLPGPSRAPFSVQIDPSGRITLSFPGTAAAPNPVLPPQWGNGGLDPLLQAGEGMTPRVAAVTPAVRPPPRSVAPSRSLSDRVQFPPPPVRPGPALSPVTREHHELTEEAQEVQEAEAVSEVVAEQEQAIPEVTPQQNEGDGDEDVLKQLVRDHE